MELLRRHRVLLTSGCLLIVSLLLLSVGHRARPYRDPVATLLLDALAPFQIASTWVRRGFDELWSGYVALVQTQRENEALRQRVGELEREVARLAEIEHSNQRLAELLRFQAAMDGNVLGARVVARDPLPWFRTLTIDRGREGDVRRGMAVIAPQGVVGQISEVSRKASRVMLLTDRNSGIDALIQRSRARGIVQGAQDELCSMNYLSRDADVVVGDRVLTSGLDGLFPKGVMIGEVVEVSRRHRGLLQAAVIRPSVPLDRLEEVLVVDATVEIAEPPS